MTPDTILRMMEYEKTLPELNETDKAYMLGYFVALETAGIGNDANREKGSLERAIRQLAWRIVYCRYVDGLVAVKQRPRTYDDWKKHQSPDASVNRYAEKSND